MIRILSILILSLICFRHIAAADFCLITSNCIISTFDSEPIDEDETKDTDEEYVVHHYHPYSSSNYYYRLKMDIHEIILSENQTNVAGPYYPPELMFLS